MLQKEFFSKIFVGFQGSELLWVHLVVEEVILENVKRILVCFEKLVEMTFQVSNDGKTNLVGEANLFDEFVSVEQFIEMTFLD